MKPGNMWGQPLNKVSIRQKLTGLLLVIGLLPTLVVSIVAYVNISRQLTSKTVSQIASIAVKQDQKINGLLQSKQEDALRLANQYDLQTAISDYITGRAKSSAAIDAIFQAKKIDATDIQSIYLTTPGNVVYASTSDNLGTKLQNLNSTKAGQENSITVQTDPTDNIEKVFIATRMSVNQQDVGTLTLTYDIDDFVATIQDYTGLGATGDTIVAALNSNGNPVSLFPLRFDSDAALSTRLDSLHLFQHVDTNYTSIDYRNHAVMVSVQPVAYANWVTATTIDTSEAYQPIVALRTALILIVLASSVVIVLVALYFSRFFTAPLIALTEKTRAIMQGDFNQRIAVTSGDEVGSLATAFNEMTASLQTSSRRLGEEHARLQGSINSLNLGFLMTTKDGRIAICNPAMFRIMGLAPSVGTDVNLQAVQDRLPNFDLLGAVRECLATGLPFTGADINMGSKFLSVMGSPIRLGGDQVIGSVMVVEDITEAKILARSKDEFFSIASHELRTPLTAINGNTSMILQYFPELVKDKNVKEMLEDIQKSSVRLIDIVNDFLDVSRIEQGKILFKNEAFFVEKTVESVVYEMRPVLTAKKLYLKFDRMTLESLPQVWADADRTKQIVYNLVGNAAKFTESGGITVSSEVVDKFIKIKVTDTGRGIPLDKQQLLFHKFQQAGNSLITRDTSRGTGLGLYISKMLVERMGGEIRLESSAVGKGTTFSFTLPTATEAQQKAKKAPKTT